MAEFVNYKSRAVTLPLGCKDLMDLLPGEEVGAEDKQNRLRTEQFTTLGLAHVDHYVSAMMAVPRRIYVFSISHPDSEGFLSLRQTSHREPPILHVGLQQAAQESAVREFFKEKGLTATGDQEISSKRFLQFRLSLEAKQVSEMLVDLMQRVYGVTASSGLVYRYFGYPE